MNCPACAKQLSKQKIGPVELDVCDQGCHGVWFDAHELKKFDEAHEPAEPVSLNAKREVAAKADLAKRRNCPKCKSIVMLRRFASVKRKVEVDECGKCAGIWLDMGELEEIRNEFKTEGDRTQAAEKCFDELFGAQLAQERQNTKVQLDSARRIGHALRFISPSYYLKR